MSALSPAQEMAATHRGHLLVAACPGAGKTTVLKYRAENLLRGSDRSRLAAVTFTSEAAASLKSRIIQQFPAAKPRVLAGTFHNLCGQQLKRAGQDMSLLNEPKSLREIGLLLDKCPLPHDGITSQDAAAQIQAWQRELDAPVPGELESPMAWVYHGYTRSKATRRVRDFGDLILHAVQGMRSGEVPPLDVQFMLVDEFQDTDGMQLEWVLAHARNGTQVTIVGDDDQSIYGWRGSLGYDGMLRFQRETDATLVTLDRTFRCTVPVLKPAAVLIGHNLARVPKQLVTSNGNPGKAQVRTFEDRDAEVQGIVRAIMDSGDGGKWGVIARTNALLDGVEASLARHGMPYTRSGGRSFWDQKAPSLLMGMAQSLSNRDMEGIGELIRHARVRPQTLDEMCSTLKFGKSGSLEQFVDTGLPRSTSRNDRVVLQHFQNQARQWMKLTDTPNGVQLALNGMALSIQKMYPWRGNEAQESPRRLAQAAASIGQMNGSLSQRLRALSSSRKQADGEGSTSLLTMHASKGLEFEHVWIVGVEDGVIPSARDGSDMDEERRLLYVGITRAMSEVTLSYTLERGASRFLKEARLLGSDLLG